MTKNPKLTAAELGIPKYEVLGCEPLHDITNVVQNLKSELPNNIDDKAAKQEYDKFYQTTIGDKNQLKGSDARLYAIKLTKFTQYLQGRVAKQILDLVTSLVEIIKIC